MDSIIEAILKIFPIDTWLIEKFELSEKQAQGMVFLLLLLLLSAAVAAFRFVQKLFEKHSLLKKSHDLKPQWDYQAVEKARKYYIPTQYQNASPARQEEPGFTHQYVARNPLIPFFIHQAFNEKADSERFYLILADSGMGKTTFMVNLYLEYHSFKNRNKTQKMRLFRFSDQDTMTEIANLNAKGIEEVKNTILLLDALDEDPNIVSKDPQVSDEMAFRKRLDEIIDATRNFCEVIITCRTQYFPGQENDPYELKIRRADEKGFYTLNKLYVSPFTNEEVKTFLRKKYGWLPFVNQQKKERAEKVVAQSRHLVMRPMMLSYIDYLVEDQVNFDTTYSIYETLVEKWLLREGEKRKQTHERAAFIENLRQLSEHAAAQIYQNWTAEKRMDLTKEEAVRLAENHQIELRPEEVTGQSLLTCDGVGNWKFAHKSIMEFFLAKTLAKQTLPVKNFVFGGMDMTKLFFTESQEPLMLFVEGGTFLMGSPEDEPERQDNERQHEVSLSDFYLSAFAVTLGQFECFISETKYLTDAEKGGGSHLWTGKEWKQKAGVNWRHDVNGVIQKDKRHPVIHVSWNDATAYCEWLSQKKSKKFRLPTEAEWEYACRAGTMTIFYTGNILTSEQANYDGTAIYNGSPKGTWLKKTTPVGSYPPNPWGFYDMAGNVWEWCQDWYGDYPAEPQTNPKGAESGSLRVIRGGGWFNDAQLCRAAIRLNYSPEVRWDDLGFRLALSLQSDG